MESITVPLHASGRRRRRKGRAPPLLPSPIRKSFVRRRHEPKGEWEIKSDHKVSAKIKPYGNEEPDGAEKIGIVHVARGMSQHQITNGRQEGLRVITGERSFPMRNNTGAIINSGKFNSTAHIFFLFSYFSFLRLVTLMSRIIPADRARRGRSTWLQTATSYRW